MRLFLSLSGLCFLLCTFLVGVAGIAANHQRLQLALTTATKRFEHSYNGGYNGAAGPDRMVMYWATWKNYPAPSVASTYTDVILFAVAAYNNACSVDLGSYISPDQISYFRQNAPHTKLLFSFGGANQNDYWQYCNAQTLAKSLASAVTQNGFDGVDIDYEVNPVNTQFLIELTHDLRRALGSHYLITHAPENTQLTTGSNYWNVLLITKNAISWIGIQYYNDNPGAGDIQATLNHYTNVVNGIFGGDASKVVAGVCVQDSVSPNCNTGWSVTGSQTASLATTLKQAFPSSFGGIFGYQASSDNGSWSSPVIQALNA